MDSKKKCSCCQVFKDKSCYGFKNKKLSKLQARCKECQSLYSKEHYMSNKSDYCKRARKNNIKYKKRNQNFIREYKTSIGCKFCKETSHICLDFHHLNPKMKDWNISILSRGANSIKTIQKEIKKCIVICSNCHRKLHAGLIRLDRNAIKQQNYIK